MIGAYFWILKPFESAPPAGSTVECGGLASYDGGESYPYEVDVTLGSGTGTVTLDYDALNVPDKFIVIYDGVEVINTGYRGNAANQTALDNALIARGESTEIIQGTGEGTAAFNKTTSTSIARVKVYAPIGGTAWSFTLSCPE